MTISLLRKHLLTSAYNNNAFIYRSAFCKEDSIHYPFFIGKETEVINFAEGHNVEQISERKKKSKQHCCFADDYLF